MSDNNGMISDEAVEAAARWLWERDSNDIVEGPRPRWDDLPTSGIVWRSGIEDTRQEARELLEAAAPHMLAEAWDEGRVVGSDEERSGYITEDNPYRS